MYRILLAIDSNEERARTIAEAVAALPGSRDELEAVILNVKRKLETREEGTEFNSEDWYDETDFPESVGIATDVLEKHGIAVSSRREHGDPADMIVSVADEIDADAIAITGRRRSPTGKAIFGSVTQSVLLSTDRPVHVMIQD